MTNKLVLIINSLKVPKIKKILLYEIKFLVPNYSCLQNPWLGGLPPPDHHSLCSLSSIEFVEPLSRPNKIPGYATVSQCTLVSSSQPLVTRVFTCLLLLLCFVLIECKELQYFTKTLNWRIQQITPRFWTLLAREHNSIILLSVLLKVHCPFQSEFPTECDLVPPPFHFLLSSRLLKIMQ